MAKTYSVSLTHSTAAGYFTVAKGAASGTEADWHKEQGNLLKAAMCSVRMAN
ncbi:MAG: hypothetical protein SPL62_09290 [Selenomonas sp.]|nr:hypothetical protein [Selenomonas sp.]